LLVKSTPAAITSSIGKVEPPLFSKPT
jgi:hypothetical protein